MRSKTEMSCPAALAANPNCPTSLAVSPIRSSASFTDTPYSPSDFIAPKAAAPNATRAVAPAARAFFAAVAQFVRAHRAVDQQPERDRLRPLVRR
jgi:hypothetical protein